MMIVTAAADVNTRSVAGSPTLIDQIATRLEQNGWDFVLNNPEEATLQPGSLAQRIKLYFSRAERQRQAEKVAQVVTGYLILEPRGTPAQNIHLSSLKAARQFRKVIAPQCAKTAPILDLLDEEASLRLGLDSSVARANKIFFDWAKYTRIYTYLARFDHAIQVDAASQIALRFNGGLAPWSEIEPTAQRALAEAKRFPHEEAGRPQFYDEQDGVIYRDRYEVKELTPLITRDESPYGNRYILRISVHDMGRAGITENHSFFGFISPKTEEAPSYEYSFSVYRQAGKHHCAGVFGGYINLLECSQTWDYPNYSIDGDLLIELTAEKFKELTDKYVALANSPVPLPFQSTDGNCTSEITRLLREDLGYRLPDYRISFWRVLLPTYIVGPSLWIDGKLPSLLQKAARKTVAVFGNFVSFYFEAHKVGPEYKSAPYHPLYPGIEAKRITPHLRTWRDLFDSTKMLHASPYDFNQQVIQPALAWRKTNNSPYGIPPEWTS